MALLLASCSGSYPVEVGAVDRLTGVWSDWTGATVEFADDGTFTAEGLDTADVVGWGCSGFAARQRGTWSPSGSHGRVAFDGVDCADMELAFYGSPGSFVFCFTRDVASGGCAHEFSRTEARSTPSPRGAGSTGQPDRQATGSRGVTGSGGVALTGGPVATERRSDGNGEEQRPCPTRPTPRVPPLPSGGCSAT